MVPIDRQAVGRRRFLHGCGVTIFHQLTAPALEALARPTASNSVAR